MAVLPAPGVAALLAGQAVSAVGNWVALIAIWGFAAFRFDAGATDLALLLVALSVPGVVLGPLLGLPIDRLGPRRTLLLANLVGGASALALTQAGSYRAVIVLALPLGLVEATVSASLGALVPQLVPDEHLVRANALLGVAEDAAIVVGPLVAAAVNARFGLPGAFLADAATFAAAAVVVVALRADPHPPAATGPAWPELRRGARVARRNPGVRWALGVAMATYSLWAVFAVLEPLYVRDVLGAGDTVFALLQAAFGTGLVGAGVVLAGLGDRVARPRYVALATVASGATAALYLGTEWPVVAAVGVFLWGVAVAFFHVPARTLLQRHAPVAARGRVLAIHETLEPLATLLVTPAVALGVGLVSVRALGVGGGALAAASGLVALRLSLRLPAPPGAGPPPVTPAVAAGPPGRGRPGGPDR